MYPKQQKHQSIAEAGLHIILPRLLGAELTCASRVGPSSKPPAPVVPGNQKTSQTSTGRCLEQMRTNIYLNHHSDNLLFRKLCSCKIPKENDPDNHLGSVVLSKWVVQGSSELRPSHQGSFITEKVPLSEKAMIGEKKVPKSSNNIQLRSSRELLTESFIHTRQKSLEKYLSSVRPKRVLGNLLQKLNQTNLEIQTPNLLCKMMTESKVSAAAFQMLFYQRFELSQQLTALMVSLVPHLLLDKFGCHVLRRVCLASDQVMRSICDLTTSQFCTYSKNEHSSRVMQTLAAVQPLFASACLNLVCLHWKTSVEEVPIYYLLSICLKHVENHTDAFQNIGLQLYSHKSDLLEFKYLKKILCIYLEFCKHTEVGRFYKDLDFENEFKRRYQDKHMVNILRVLVQVRGFPAAIGFFEEISTKGMLVPETIDKYFFIQKIVDGKNNLQDRCGVFAIDDIAGDATLQRPRKVHLLTNQRLSSPHVSELESRQYQGHQLSPLRNAFKLDHRIDSYHSSKFKEQ